MLSRGWVLENGCLLSNCRWDIFQGPGDGLRSLPLPGSNSRSTESHILSLTFSNTLTEQTLPFISANSIERRRVEERERKGRQGGEEEGDRRREEKRFSKCLLLRGSSYQIAVSGWRHVFSGTIQGKPHVWKGRCTLYPVKTIMLEAGSGGWWSIKPCNGAWTSAYTPAAPNPSLNQSIKDPTLSLPLPQHSHAHIPLGVIQREILRRFQGILSCQHSVFREQCHVPEKAYRSGYTHVNPVTTDLNEELEPICCIEYWGH